MTLFLPKERNGPVPVFLGMQNSGQKDYSDAKAQEIDGEVHRLISGGYETAKKILNDNLSVLHAMSESLLEYETIDTEEVDLLVKGGSLDELKKLRGEKQERVEKERAQAAIEHEENEKKKKAAEEEAKKNDGSDPIGNSGPVTA